MDPTLKSFLIFLGGLLTAGAVSYAYSRIGKNRDTKAADAETLRKEVTELKQQMAVLKAEALPLTAAFQAMLVAKLTHFHTPIMDALLEKLGPPSIITDDEMEQLEAALEERKITLNGRIDEEERIAADLLPGAIKMARLAAEKEEQAKTETVLVTQPATEIASSGATEEIE